MIQQFPCSVSHKSIGDKENSIFCDLCKLLVHIKCNNLNYVDYQYLSGCTDPWHCLRCNSEIYAFGSLNKQNFVSFIRENLTDSLKLDNLNSTSTLVLKQPANLSQLFNQFDNTNKNHTNKDPDNVVKCRYYDIEEIQTLKIPNKSKFLSMFPINTCSLSKNFDDLEYLLKTTNMNFNIIAISETRITKNVNKITNININNYAYEFTPTESSAGGNLIYVANHLAYKPRTDLQIYKRRDLESTFIEIINPKKSNIIIGCIYRHPNMDLNDFNNDYLNLLLAKLSKEKQRDFLLGHFNVDLSKYEQHSPTNEFLDSLASSMFLPCIIQPARVTFNSKTIIDNIFSNIISTDIISGNLTATISDHLPQFLIAPEIFRNSPSSKSNYFERDWSNFNRQNVILDYFSVNWKNVINLEKNDVNRSLQSFFDSVNDLLKRHAAYKKVKKYKLKFKDKPWISSGLQKSISIKN